MTLRDTERKPDLSTSNLGGIRNRHVPPGTSPAVRAAVEHVERFEESNGVHVVGITPAADGRPLTMHIQMPDSPPRRPRRPRELTQIEVPGAERPRIIPLDDAARAVLAIESELADAKARLALAKEDVQQLLVEHHLVVYLYVDGEHEYPFKLDASTKLTYKKRKRRTEEDRRHDTNDGVLATEACAEGAPR